MQCKCGFENDPDAKFCHGCGMALGSGLGGDVHHAAASPTATSVQPGKSAARPKSRASMAIVVVVVVVVAAAGYWWLRLPPGKHKADNSGLYSINVNGKYGFMDRSGKTMITPQFDAVSRFSEGLAAVKVGTKFGYINTKGIVVITPQFDGAYGFSEGLAAVQVGSKFGYINTTGLVAITPQFVDVNSFHNGRAAVKLNGELRSFDQRGKVGHIGKDRYAFIDKDGKFIGTPGFLFVQWGFGSESAWTGEVTLVRTADDRIGIMNGSGQVLIADKVDEIGFRGFTGGLAPAATGGKWGYLDTKGGWVIEPQFEQTFGFEEGLAAVEVGGRWGVIDQKGKFVVNPQYDVVSRFSEGYASFSSGKGSIPGCPQYCANYGFINTKGQVVVDAKFVQHPNPDGSYSSPVRAFSEGLAAVKTDDGWGFIDPTGKMVIDPQFDDVGSFQDGFTFVKVLGKEAYITKTGAFVIDPFPGTTVAAERSRIAAEADRAASEAETTNRAWVEQRIVGEWVGTFGRRSNARLTISLQGGVIDAVLLNGGWREVLSGGLRPDNRWLLTGTSVTRAGSSDPGPYNLDTIELELSADGDSLTGKFRDTHGNTGAVTMKKSG